MGARERKRRVVVWFERNVQNPPVRAALRAGIPLGIFALIETVGTKTGQRHQTPVIDGLHGRGARACRRDHGPADWGRTMYSSMACRFLR